MSNDINDRPYAKLLELKAGDIIELDRDFTCHNEGPVMLFIRCGQLAFKCKKGSHFLSSQADDGEYCVGVYKL